MPFCPKCRAEYREGFTRCATCGVDLVDSLEDVPEPITEDNAVEYLRGKELAVLVRGDLDSCREVCNALLQEQVPAIIAPYDENVPSARLAMLLDVLVAEEDVERAVTLLQADWHDMLERDGLQWLGVGAPEEEAEEDGPLACPACGSTAPLVDGCCPDCGLYLGDEEGEAGDVGTEVESGWDVGEDVDDFKGWEEE